MGYAEYSRSKLATPDGRNAYLNDAGEIIYPPTLDFIMLKPTWFGRGVLGSLIDAFGSTREPGGLVGGFIGYVKDCLPGGSDTWRGLNHQQGFVAYRDVEELLETSLRTTHLTKIITPEDLIELMIKLEMCYKEEPEVKTSRLFIPAVFDDDEELAANGKRQLGWKLGRRPGRFHHVGRRLLCRNTTLTPLSPGFFPRLQVVLRNYYHSKGWTQNEAFQIDRNLIGFAEDGHEVLVEYSGNIDYFIDILAKSDHTYLRTLRFIREHVMGKIINFCASPQGCPGVLLVDAVIRPFCVEQLHLCADRIDHAVLVSDLEDKLANDDEKACKHIWKKQIQGTDIVSYALDLLEGKDSYKNFKLARHGGLQVQPEDLWSPRHIFITENDVQWTSKALAKVRFARVVPFRLHLQCECRDDEHRVDRQDGRIFYVANEVFYREERFRQGIGRAGSSVLKGSGPVVSGLNAAASLPLYFNDVTPVYCDTIESLSTQFGTAAEKISDEELRIQVEENMRNSSAGPWMTAFLNFGTGPKESKKFRDDFLLMEVEYLTSSSTNSKAWVCETHCFEGVKQGTHRRII